MEIIILIFGFLFGVILQYANLNKYNTISGIAILKDLTMAKAISMAIGLGMILLSIMISLDFASYHIKPVILGGVVLGGLIFGVGMAILGYCPGTLAISAGEGSIDAIIGIIGGLFSGWLFTVLLPVISPILGPDFGSITLSSITRSGTLYYLLILIFGVSTMAISFWLNKKDKSKDNKWVYAGIALAVLNVIVFLEVTTNRPIGASTTFPYLADVLTGTTQNEYFNKINTPGKWELIFLTGSFLAGLIISLINKNFKLRLIYENWEEYKGDSVTKRIVWSFVGGFVLIFGARMAGGCTSGHILSGGMQMSLSSIVFAVFTFAGLLITGKLFYKKNK